MRHHDDPGSCVKIWWVERLSDRCDWPGSWGMELHPIRLQERYSCSKHSSTPLSSGKQQRMAPHNPDLKLLVFWFWGTFKDDVYRNKSGSGEEFRLRVDLYVEKCQQTPQRAHRRCASSIKVKVPTSSTCATPPKSGNPKIVFFINLRNLL